MSFEYKGMFVYHLAMMVMFVAGGGLTLIEQILIASAIALVVAIASFIRRLRRKWHWQGLTAMRVAGAVLMTALMGFFVFAGVGGALQAQGISLMRPLPMGPWALAAFGIAMFSILNILRITHLSEKAFEEECGDEALEPQPAPPPEPRWKVITKYVFVAAFLAVWLEGVAFFYVFDRTMRASSPTPTLERSVAFRNKGVTVFITPEEERLLDQLKGIMFVGIPAALAASFFLHYVLKIRLSILR
jgi:hypothetical protein